MWEAVTNQNIRMQTKLTLTLNCRIKESGLPKRFLIMHGYLDVWYKFYL